MRKSIPCDCLLGRSLVLVSVLALCFTAPMRAQETDTKETTESLQADDQKPLFSVPKEATPNELFGFINQVKRTAPKVRTREALLAHMKLQVEAVLAACDKVIERKPEVRITIRAFQEKLAALGALSRVDREAAAAGQEKLMKTLEADTRPEMRSFLAQMRLEERAFVVGDMSELEQAEFIDSLFSMCEKHGIDRGLYQVISGVGRIVGRSKNPKVGAELYTRLADAMEKSDDQRLVERAEKIRGSARRLKLPGSFMKVTGTTADGEDFNWASYRGKVVLVDFWASWCGPCRREIPNMKNQLAKYGKKGFDIVGVNLDTTKAAYQEYVEQHEITWTNLMSDKEEERGWDNPLAAHYGVSGIPTAILVDQRGIVVSMLARGPRLNMLLEGLLGRVEPAEETEDDAP